MTPIEAIQAVCSRVVLNERRDRNKPPGFFIEASPPEIREALSRLKPEHCQAHAIYFMNAWQPGKFGLDRQVLLDFDKKIFPRGIPREKKY